MTKTSFRNTLLCATMLMGAATTPAFAEAAAEAGTDSNEIVVTATRRVTTIQDAPINISAVGSDQLQRQRINDVKSLAAFTPGLAVADTGPRSTGNIIMRGISSSDTSTGIDPNATAVGVYLGEVPLYVDFKLLDISRVEVLQGPQGTLYGLGTLAGAVRYMPNRPNTDRVSLDVHVRGFGMSHSADPGTDVDAVVNLPIVADHIALRSVVGYYNDPGFIDYNHLLQMPGVSDPQPVRGATAAQGGFGTAADYKANFYSKKDVNYDHTFTTRNQLLLEANPDLKLYLTYAHQETSTGGRQATGAGVLGTGKYEGPWRYLEPSNRQADLFAAEFNINIAGIAQVVATTAYTNQKIWQQSDNTDLLIDLDYGYQQFPQFSSYNQSTTRYRQFNQEIRLVSTHGGPFNWVIGGFYNNLRYYSNYQEHTPGYGTWYNTNVATSPAEELNNRPDQLEYVNFVQTRTVEKAIYGEGTFHITKAFQVTGGLRYYKFDASVLGGSNVPLVDGLPYPITAVDPSQYAGGKTGADGVVWKANASYKFSRNLMVYATYSTGYRTGNVNRVAPCTFPDSFTPTNQTICARSFERNYTPDKTRNMEIGVRASLFDRRLQFTADAFHIGWSNIQVQSATQLGITGITRNANDAVSKGFDFSGTLRITPQLSLQGTYSYVDAHLTQDAANLLVSHPDTPELSGQSLYSVFAGDRLPGSPKHSGSAQITYVYPVGEGRTIEANWATTYTGDVFTRIGNRGHGEVLPSYVTHRASITYHAKMYDIGLFADNIFDKYAVTAVSNDLANKGLTRNGVVERYYATGILTPRRFGVDFRFHY